MSVHAAAQLVEALRYKGGSIPVGVDSVSKRNEYQEYLLGGKGGRCVGLITLPLSCADFLEILGSTSCSPQALPRPVYGLLYLHVTEYIMCSLVCLSVFFNRRQ